MLLDSLVPVLRKLDFLEPLEQLALADVGPNSSDWEVAIALMGIGQHSAGAFITSMLEPAEKVLRPPTSGSVALVSLSLDSTLAGRTIRRML